MIRRIFGLIPRLLQILLEFGGIAFIFWFFKDQYGTSKNIFDLSNLLFAIFMLYFVSIIIMLISWIFNIFTKFDDYSGGRFKTILLAPVFLALHAVVHPFKAIGYLFTGKTGSEDSYKYSKGSGGSGGSGKGSGGSGKSNYDEVSKQIKRATYATANRTRVGSCGTGASFKSHRCDISFFKVRVTVVYELYNTNCPVTRDKQGIEDEIRSDIINTIDAVIDKNYTGTAQWSRNVYVNFTTNPSQYFF